MVTHISDSWISVDGPPRVGIPNRRSNNSFASKRGIIVNSSSMFVSSGDTDEVRIEDFGISPQGLRFALLFWDELAFPKIPMVGPPHGPDEELLIKEGILFRPEYLASGTPSSLTNRAQEAVFKILESIEPGQWSVGDGDLAFLGHGGLLTPHGGTGLELFRAIPVPNQDVPLTEILAFKARRLPELLALRHRIESYLSDLLLKENFEGALVDYVSRVDAACVDVLKVFSEWRQPFRLSNIKVSFDSRPLVPIMAAIAAYAAGRSQVHLPVLSATLAGLGSGAATAASFFKITGDIGWAGLSERRSPFRYVKSYHRDLFGV